jgi:hypothetical protein
LSKGAIDDRVGASGCRDCVDLEHFSSPISGC